jgi:nitroreductase
VEKVAETTYPVHDLVAHRWSPRAFAEKPVETETLLSLLEAARWAASCFNAQPWRYLIATKEKPDDYARLLSCLVEFNQQWAKSAPVLMISIAKTTFDHNGKPNAHSWHDVGQASASMAIQATALGLQIHQMAGFSAEKVRELYQLPAEFEPVAAIAIGYPGDPATLPENFREREVAPSSRNAIEAFAFTGNWGNPILPDDEALEE